MRILRQIENLKGECHSKAYQKNYVVTVAEIVVVVVLVAVMVVTMVGERGLLVRQRRFQVSHRKDRAR